MATIGTESESIWGKAESKKKKKASESSHSVLLLQGVSTIPSTHDNEQAWLVHLTFSKTEFGNLQKILLMAMGLGIGRTDTETVGV